MNGGKSDRGGRGKKEWEEHRVCLGTVSSLVGQESKC
jgi:hypothetical protein